jgi:hypothetical protein
MNTTTTPERFAIDQRVRVTTAHARVPMGARATVLWEDHTGVWARVDGQLYGDVFPRDILQPLTPEHDDPQRVDRAMWLRMVREWWTREYGRAWGQEAYHAFYMYARGMYTIDDLLNTVGWFNVDAFNAIGGPNVNA